MRFKRVTALILLIAVTQLCACTGLVEKFYPEDTADPDQSVFVPVDVEEGSIYFRDFDGNVITMKQAPDKVASLSEVSTEILCGLGAGRYITAINEGSSKLEGAPIAAAVLPDFSSDADKLIELAPQIIFYSDSSLSYLVVTMLQNAGLTLVRIPEKGDISTAEANIRFISSLMYKDEGGERLINEMRDEFEKMKVASELVGLKKRVYIEGTVTYTAYGADSIISQLCAYAGAENVFADKTGTNLTSPVELKAKDPEVIIVLSKNADSFSVDSVRKREGLEDVYAVRTKAIYAIDYTAATRPTQNITKALKDVAEALKIIK